MADSYLSSTTSFSNIRPLPRDHHYDSTLALMRDPYRYIARQCDLLGADIFETRLILHEAVCMRGAEAAALFYDSTAFQRQGALPLRLQRTLFGRGGVQTMDGEAHQRRKRLFLDLMSQENIDALGEIFEQQLLKAFGRWRAEPQLVLYEGLKEVLTRSVCAWAGVPLLESEIDLRKQQLSALYETAGAIGLKHWQGRWARVKAEQWAADWVERVRAGTDEVPQGSPLHAIATQCNAEGRLLDKRVAAVEVINLLRPTVAVAVYLLFEAHALEQLPGLEARLLNGGSVFRDGFVNEVRRFYPFFPSVMAVARHDVAWQGYVIPKGWRAVLDLYGTCHDPRIWQEPETFRPERFKDWRDNGFSLIPQGGGQHAGGHRCAGEWVTLELMKRFARLLCERLEYEVPPQDLQLDMTHLPALPRSRIIIRQIGLRN
ncbi:fatty-acid peroxygenase [Novimethylophilus kurashikiensis]|uniref:Fatty-acid peroxygenase n=1 Tax=Novimethylophilus kurashikiensis TaxID=1825523 RepID=A0A2R5FBS9_9PROT|nr:cytochrome P450 [Novimethylophilus kurashikiensis]GBG15008.1 fatty-acid peroxygenase [Novimethylophilus kurashikiensis]